SARCVRPCCARFPRSIGLFLSLPYFAHKPNPRVSMQRLTTDAEGLAMRSKLLALLTAFIAGSGMTLAQGNGSVSVTPPAAASPVCESICLCDDCCSDRGSCWGKIEYLLWWIKDEAVPPLVTTGNPADISPPPGALG